MIHELAEVVAEHPFFAGLDPEYAELVAGCGKLAAFEPGAHLARNGAAAESFFLIRRGKVALELSIPGRDPFVFGSVGEGDMLGWSWLFEPYVWQFDARALDAVGVIQFDGACLRGKCEADSVLGYELMKRFSRVLVQRFADTRLQLMDVYGNLR